MTNVKLKQAYEIESKHGAFFTGGNVEWLTDDKLICQNGGLLRVLDIETGSVCLSIGQESEDQEQPEDIIETFGCDSRCIVTSHASGLLKLWAHEGVLVKSWKSIHRGPIASIRLDSARPQTAVLATGGSDGSVRLWQLERQTCTQCLRVDGGGVINVVAFHPTQDVLFASGDDGTITSWNLTNGQVVHAYRGHLSKVTSIAFHRDNIHMMTAGRDKVVVLWDIINHVPIRTVPVFESVECIVSMPKKFYLSGTKYKSEEDIYVATAGEEGAVTVWELKGAKRIYFQERREGEQVRSPITKLVPNTTTTTIAVVDAQQNIAIHYLKIGSDKSFSCAKQFVGFSDEILDVCFMGENDSYLAVATNSADVKLYQCATMSCQLLRGHTDIVLSLSGNETNRQLLLSSGKDNVVRLWRMDENGTCRCLAVGVGHAGSVGSIAFSHMSTKFAASASQDGCVKMWEVEITSSNEGHTLMCKRTEMAHDGDVNCVAISPNDKLIGTCSQDKTARLWTADELSLIGVLRGHKRGVWCIRFSPVDQIVATSSADRTIKLWSVADLNCVKTLTGHECAVLRLEFMSLGMQIMTGGADGLLKLFDIKSSECTTTMDGHEGRIWAVAVRDEGAIIMSGGSDSLLIKWRDVTAERKSLELKQKEELTAREQQLSNLVRSGQMTEALGLSLELERPAQTLRIIREIIRESSGKGLSATIHGLSVEQKERLTRCATQWNSNAKNCQPAQLVLNALLDEIQPGKPRPAGLREVIESSLPYTERHYKRLTQLLQDLHFVGYTLDCMQPHAKMC